MQKFLNSKQNKNIKKHYSILLIPICLFSLNKIYPCEALQYIMFIIPFIYLFLGQFYAAFLYSKLKTKYNYCPHSWVQAPSKHSTYYKTLQYLTEKNDMEYIEKFKKMNHAESIAMIMLVEAIILFVLGTII